MIVALSILLAQLGKRKVDDFNAIPDLHKMFRCQVAVNYPLLVRVSQSRRRLTDYLRRQRRRQRSLRGDKACQILACDVLHHQEVPAVDLINVVHVDNVGVVDAATRCAS